MSIRNFVVSMATVMSFVMGSIGSIRAEEPRSTPLPVPLTRPEMKQALEDLKGRTPRIPLPELTEERRREFIKLAKAKAEDGRVAVRNLRRSAKQALDRAEKDSEISQDDNTGAEKRLDGLTKKHIDVIDDLLKHKEAELLEV